jgi:anti-sigma-K factor RskA
MTDDPATTALAGEFALGLLEPADRRAAEALFERDPAFQESVQRWQAHFAALDATAAPLTPSPALWDRLASGIQRRPSVRIAPEAGRIRGAGLLGRFWGNIDFWRPFGMAGAFASLVFAVLFTNTLLQGPETPKLVAVLAAPDGRAAAIVNAYADGTVHLVPLDQVAVPEGRILEVWTLQTRERGPVSVGRMDQARTLKLNLRGLSPAQVGHLFEITVEPEGGSPTGRPTGPVLMKGLAATRL